MCGACPRPTGSLHGCTSVLASPPKHWRTQTAATSRGASQEAPDHPLGTLLAVGQVGEHVPGEGCELRDDAQQREELHLVRVRVGVRVGVRVRVRVRVAHSDCAE